MGTAGKLAQNATRVVFVDGLAVDLSVRRNHGVGTDNRRSTHVFGIATHLLHNGARLALGELFGGLLGLAQQIGLEGFINIGAQHRERNALSLEQFAAAGAPACKNDFNFLGHELSFPTFFRTKTMSISHSSEAQRTTRESPHQSRLAYISIAVRAK